MLPVSLKQSILDFIFLLNGLLKAGVDFLELLLQLVVLLHELFVLLGQVLDDFRLALHFFMQPVYDTLNDF